MIKTVKASTKMGMGLVAQAERPQGYTLADVYGRYSQAKANAFEKCRRMCEEMHGDDLVIVSHNTFGFSVAWWTSEGLHYVTPTNHYIVVFGA